MTEQPIPVVLYASLSKKAADEKRGEESIASQLAKARERVHRLGGRVVIGEFTDEGHSGSKKNRGPGLEAAIAAVAAGAEQHGQAELMANTSARFARGTGKRDEARAVGELYYDLRRRGVALRTVEDDEFVTNEMLVGFASAQAAKYASDLSESVKRSKRRQARNGERLGGPLPLGYRKASNPVAVDGDHAPTIERIFELADKGVPDTALARTINAEGHRTRAGRPFDRRSVQTIVVNAFYSGRIAHDGELYDGGHPALVDPATFDAIQVRRPERDRGAGRHKAGRPARRHLLTSLATCAKCGAPMYSATSSYRRKDGTRARTYACRSYRSGDGTCDAKAIDAEIVDAAVLDGLRDLLPDFDAWFAQIEDRHDSERLRVAEQVDRARADRDDHAHAVERHERSYRRLVADDDAKADAALGFVLEARSDLQAAQTRLAATEDALASIPEQAPRDKLLDFGISLRAQIAGRVDAARDVEQVNRALVEFFASVLIHETEWGSPKVLIAPILRVEVVHHLPGEWPKLIERDGAPLRPITSASRNSGDSCHQAEFREAHPVLALPVIEAPLVGPVVRTPPTRWASAAPRSRRRVTT